ncbi:DUF1775 domain-containing protein [Barrientosiimonas marina]|uniref:YcnI family protein n=1 Tax=Lentibacillus kimchii TaxID=1542911 RepID=A0ABW2UW24_9BACI
MTHKKWIAPLVVLLALFLTAPAASAHVTLHPEKSSTDAWAKYTVRVPVEKDMNTTKLELDVPEEADLVSVMPKEGWDYELEKDDDDVITSVTWEATDGGVGPNEFTEFNMVVTNPSEPTDVSWNAYQTYEDGSVVEWDGGPDSDEPAPVTKVVSGDATAQHSDDNDSSDATQADDNTDEASTTSGGSNWLPITLSAVAILLAVISLFRKRS